MTSPDGPLCSKHVLVTRVRGDADALSTRLQRLGASVVALPVIAIRPSEDPAPLESALRQLSHYDWIAFTSRNAVRAVFDRLAALDVPAFPAGLRVAAVGPSTAAELAARGVAVDCLPPQATGAALAAAMVEASALGVRVLLPVGDLSRPETRQGLEATGAHVDQVVVYQPVPPDDVDLTALDALRHGTIDAIALASPSAVKNLAEMLGSDLTPLQHVRLACIGPTTAAAVRDLGVQPSTVATQHTLDGLVQAVLDSLTTENRYGRT